MVQCLKPFRDFKIVVQHCTTLGRLAALMVAVPALLTPALAQDWDSYFNMDTFGAGGGSDTNGWLNFECAYASSGYPTAGRAHLQVRVMDSAKLAKKSLPAQVIFTVGSDRRYALPMELTPGATDDLTYAYSEQTTPIMLGLIAALRNGNTVTADLGDQRLISINLNNSSTVLDAIEDCAAEGPAG